MLWIFKQLTSIVVMIQYSLSPSHLSYVSIKNIFIWSWLLRLSLVPLVLRCFSVFLVFLVFSVVCKKSRENWRRRRSQSVCVVSSSSELVALVEIDRPSPWPQRKVVSLFFLLLKQFLLYYQELLLLFRWMDAWRTSQRGAKCSFYKCQFFQ